jgi:hypothetical protein
MWRSLLQSIIIKFIQLSPYCITPRPARIHGFGRETVINYSITLIIIIIIIIIINNLYI